MSVDHGGLEILVTEQFLDGSDIIAGFRKMGGKTLPERWDGCVFENVLSHVKKRLFTVVFHRGHQAGFSALSSCPA
jgi:hypothetical protein